MNTTLNWNLIMEKKSKEKIATNAAFSIEVVII